MTETRKLAAVMFTDIAGYTALMSKDEKKALTLLQKNRELQQALAEKHNGEFLKEMGDGTLLCFQSALDAVRCAMEIQMSGQDDPDLNLRIGIHLGDIVFKDGDVFGDGVNVASRIEALAEVGGICISEQIQLQIRNQPKIYISDQRVQTLKNLEQPIKIYSLLDEDNKSGQTGFQVPKGIDSQDKSIIILPFENMSSDPEQEYFSDGLTEEIITDLSHVQDLRVISRTSARMLKGTKKDMKTIGYELNVKYVLEGSVRKSGNNLRITAQLIDAKTDTHLWAEKYGGTLDDIFDIQEKVSRSIVDALKVKLTHKESKQIAERPINNIHAYDCYLKARQEMWKWTEDGLDRAKQLIESGLKIIGDNELLYVAKGVIYTQYINFVISKDRTLLDHAEECALRALDLNPESSGAYYLLGFINHWKQDMKQAVMNMKKSLKLNPKNSESLNMLAYWHAMSGRSSGAAPLFDEALKLDPLNPLIYMFRSAGYLYEGNFEAALEYNRRHYQLDPHNPLMRVFYSYLLAYTNRQDEACKNADLLYKDVQKSPWAQLGVFLRQSLLGNKAEALKSATEDLKNAMKDNNVYPLLMADCYSLISEKDEAINWVENATQWGFINYHYLNKHALFLENIRGEERFKKLMKQIKNEWENFEV